MRAAYTEELGPPEVIRYGELPVPQPGPTDVVVEVTATAVNHVDTFVRSGAWRTPLTFPFVVGRDLVGTVAEAGPGAPGFRPGDRVWCNSMGHDGRQGAAAERVVVPADRLYRLPDGVDPVEAVALAHPAATAYLALFTHGRLRAGETVLVAGAAGNVGSALVVMAAQAGARVVATSRAEDADYCRALGAAEVIDYRDPEAVYPGGVDVYVDTSGRNDLSSAVELLAKRGRVVVMAGLRTRPVLPVGPLYLKDCSVTGFAISQATTSELADAAAAINRLTASGLLRPRAVEVLPLSEAAEAHRRVEAGEVRGKLVLRAP
ncbi:NADPH:quinone reductase [Streptomyces morookaense]|uniref:NADPH:quinone reductase n=1 Tax=Streptomyces morookaense TaxID=1970 RepID=A0A7Y7B561_STRMO|nr:NADPH:quinone reductase [Streptomyces morookaense]NVK79221.1 NADPH:quinone reductase [Streptomyces morookaense]GHF27668.1 oxidoreductase [Streptomyces morookaense]